MSVIRNEPPIPGAPMPVEVRVDRKSGSRGNWIWSLRRGPLTLVRSEDPYRTADEAWAAGRAALERLGKGAK